MRGKRITAWGIALAVCLASFACRVSAPRGTAQNTYAGDESGEVTETIGDPTLARELVMESIRTERRDERLFVQFNLRNTKNNNLSFEWAILWFDTRGFALDTPRHWTPAALGGQGFETISRTAPTPEADGFRLGFRKPNVVRR